MLKPTITTPFPRILRRREEGKRGKREDKRGEERRREEGRRRREEGKKGGMRKNREDILRGRSWY